jgi:hypothetical protein
MTSIPHFINRDDADKKSRNFSQTDRLNRSNGLNIHRQNNPSKSCGIHDSSQQHMGLSPKHIIS